MTPRAAILLCLLTLGFQAADAPARAGTGRNGPPGGDAAFQTRVKPLLGKYCLGCHGEKKKGDLDLRVYTDEASVLRDRRTFAKVIKNLQAHEMPPEKKPQPTPEERELIAAWIQSEIFKCDCDHPDPGRVTIRRLNRSEYNNTIRDLVGVDFNPAEDFPSDDIGHGFDNIGDVLSLSPVLMERYLAAAESIVQRAILPNPPPPTKRHVSTKYAEPSIGDFKARFRPISTKPSNKANETGPLFTSYKVPDDGEYIFRTRVYGKSDDDAPL